MMHAQSMMTHEGQIIFGSLAIAVDVACGMNTTRRVNTEPWQMDSKDKQKASANMNKRKHLM